MSETGTVRDDTLLTELADARDRLARHTAKASTERARVYRLIAAANQAGVPKVTIAEKAGVARQNVHMILKRIEEHPELLEKADS